MSLKFNASDRKQLTATVVGPVDVDISSATLDLDIDGERYSCDWNGPATTVDGQVTRSGKTISWFAGPEVPADDLAGAHVLSYGHHEAKLVVTDSTGHVIVAVDLPLFFILR